jgi:hypothetical protein
MGRFVIAYTGPNSRAPAWGDDDDARALPLGGSPRRDHRYLPGVIGIGLGIDDLAWDLGASRAEAVWLVGAEAAASLRPGSPEPTIRRFDDGGVVVLSAGSDHVFVDCGEVGLAGRGGHGHNDCLSFEAVLAGVPIVVDPGTYVYTASREWRNRFRATAAHNTPLVDDEEQAPVDPASLWRIAPDARGEILEVRHEGVRQLFRGAHDGYRRLADGVRIIRTIDLDTEEHRLRIRDDLVGSGRHGVRIPLQLPPAAHVDLTGRPALIEIGDRRFTLTWEDMDAWKLELDAGWVSPSYGIRREAPRLVWSHSGLLVPLEVMIGL